MILGAGDTVATNTNYGPVLLYSSTERQLTSKHV